MYSRIARALSEDYFSIYYVNIETDDFVEYSSNGGYRNLNIERSGSDFFELSIKNIKRVIYVEDRDKLIEIFRKDVILREIEKNKIFTYTYRLMFGDEPTYVSLKAIKMIDDDKHIVIGVNNVDVQMKREEAYAKALGSAREIANKDSLTGVKSKYAYTEAEEQINARILSEDKELKFAVVVCDVNGLKLVNDNLGHKIGDEYIKEACSIVCEVFKHSPVFRIGGDEFAVILQDGDYRERRFLMEKLKQRVNENTSYKIAVLSAGLSEYDPDADKSFSSVLERADALMYRDKVAIKSAANKDR